MRKVLIAANWKMYKTPAEAKAFIDAFLPLVKDHIRVVRPLGMGLDEKAVEAVGKWKFKPGQKDGHPVAVMANVEVNFRLL